MCQIQMSKKRNAKKSPCLSPHPLLPQQCPSTSFGHTTPAGPTCMGDGKRPLHSVSHHIGRVGPGLGSSQRERSPGASACRLVLNISRGSDSGKAVPLLREAVVCGGVEESLKLKSALLLSGLSKELPLCFFFFFLNELVSTDINCSPRKLHHHFCTPSPDFPSGPPSGPGWCLC